MGDNWRKSSYSGANGGSCVETASGVGMILVRDAADHDGFTLSVPADAWARFTRSLPSPPGAGEPGTGSPGPKP